MDVISLVVAGRLVFVVSDDTVVPLCGVDVKSTGLVVDELALSDTVVSETSKVVAE